MSTPDETNRESPQGSEDTIRVRRRRPSGPSQAGERERAEAPIRRQAAERQEAEAPRQQATTASAPVSYRPPAGPSSVAPTQGLNPMFLLIVGVVLILLLVFVLPGLMNMMPEPSDVPTDQQPLVNVPLATEPPQLPRTTVTPTPLSTAGTAGQPPVAKTGTKWLVMLYDDADDKILEQDIFVDLNEAERVGSTDRVQIVAQMDRFRGGFQGDRDWITTKRFYITRDDDLQRIASRELTDLGEVNMADPRTLVDFATWAIRSYPADKLILIMSDHGMGWPGGWSDPEPQTGGLRNVPLAAAIGNNMFLMQIDDALAEIRAQTGIDKLELIGMDACLMSHLEVYAALAPHARYAVASQETEPALGWAYTRLLSELTANPDMSGADLGRIIVRSYIQEDQRILDDQARADLLRQTSGMAGLFGAPPRISAEQLAAQMEQNITLTAVDLAHLPALMSSMNSLSAALQDADQQRVARARSYAQSFTSIFGSQVPPSYIDIGNFVRLLKRDVGNQNVAQAADRVLAALSQFVVAEKHGPNKPGASGVSIYFPNSQLYGSPVAGAESYTAIARRFARESLWDDFLLFHYTGGRFKAPASTGVQGQPTASAGAVPQRGATINAPGAGKIEVSAIRLSSNTAAPGKPIVLKADVSGQKIGYIYLFVGYLDSKANSIFIADMDYLESPETREIQGVYYPDWGSKSKFTLEFEWEPLMFAITDGQTSATALLRPERYGATSEQAVYTVEGTYTFARGGEPVYTRLYFSNGTLRHVYGFTGQGETGAPREIVPEPGDKVTILERWMDANPRGQPVKSVTQPGKTLTFGKQTLTWKELDAAAGDYVIGLIAQDLDGNSYQSYAKVAVK